jgi:hypothetical protein
MAASAPRFDTTIQDLLNEAVRLGIAAAANGIVPPKNFLTNSEAAIRLDVEADTLTLWRSKGKGPEHVGEGKMVRYSVKAVDDYIAALPTIASKGAVAA